MVWMYTIVHTIFCMPNKYVLRADLQPGCKIVYTQGHTVTHALRADLQPSCKIVYNSCFFSDTI